MNTVLIAGGTGLVGKQLSRSLKDAGYDIRLLSRFKPTHAIFPTFLWNIEKGVADKNAFEGVDIVINLAGTGVADKPWTKARKKEITESRVKSNQLFNRYFNDYHRPSLYLSAGAIGFYGNRGEEILTEEAEGGADFLSESCQLWERSVYETAHPDMRLVIFRIGMVLSMRGGALQKMLLPWKMGISGSFGSGNQWVSWIHEEDLVRLFLFGIREANLRGIYNAVAPNPEKMIDFARTMSARSKLPWHFVCPVPGIMLSTAMGEMSTILTNSARVSSLKVRDLGFQFKFSELDEALKNLMG